MKIDLKDKKVELPETTVELPKTKDEIVDICKIVCPVSAGVAIATGLILLINNSN